MEKDQYKIVLLGDQGVGKSSIVLRFVKDDYNEEQNATVGASYTGKILQVNDKIIKFNIWDTAGQERYQSLAKMYYRDANAAIMVYDITKRSSFEGILRWYKELKEFGPKNIVICIAGNKEDLVEMEDVQPSEVKELAKSIGAIYRKVSAKTSYGVEQMFKDLSVRLESGSDAPSPTKNATQSVFLTEKPIPDTKKKKKCC
ncbi:unnamed protein product [Blepharisma stoltei]|uniref:Uncharacterized protein n=1 Tax=Blepharisma stoltei TaxID=1481888 RepID=A0AAU9K3Y4_9CILI|nr:unnamed protein product [Blepharisma stoltei]